MSRPVHQVPHLPFGRLAGFTEVGVDLPRGTNLHAVRIESSGCHSYSTRTTRRAKAERLDSMIRSHPEDFGGPPLVIRVHATHTDRKIFMKDSGAVGTDCYI